MRSDFWSGFLKLIFFLQTTARFSGFFSEMESNEERNARTWEIVDRIGKFTMSHERLRHEHGKYYLNHFSCQIHSALLAGAEFFKSLNTAEIVAGLKRIICRTVNVFL